MIDRGIGEAGRSPPDRPGRISINGTFPFKVWSDAPSGKPERASWINWMCCGASSVSEVLFFIRATPAFASLKPARAGDRGYVQDFGSTTDTVKVPEPLARSAVLGP